MPLLGMLKGVAVGLIGRDRANALSAPWHDWRAARRTRSFLSTIPTDGLRVNVGCGWRPLPGWVNLDQARGELVDVVWDLRRGLPFRSSSCSAILLEHVLEHLPREKAVPLLTECRRCLMPDGGLRVSVPDAEKYLRSYAGDRGFLYAQAFPDSIDAPIDRINQMMREGGQHLWAYDAELLGLFLRRAGFGRVTSAPYGESRFSLLAGVDNPLRREESLYMDASRE